jgi:hypothetical protein
VTYFKALETHYKNSDLQNTSTNENEQVIYPTMDARTFKSMICNRSMEGANKNVTMNQICDRVDLGYTVYDMDPDTGELEVSIVHR